MTDDRTDLGEYLQDITDEDTERMQEELEELDVSYDDSRLEALEELSSPHPAEAIQLINFARVAAGGDGYRREEIERARDVLDRWLTEDDDGE